MSEKLLNVKEVAEALGVKVPTVRKMVLERRIPFVKIGSLVRFKPETVRQIQEGGLR